MVQRQGQGEPFLTRLCTGQKAKSQTPKWMATGQTTRSVFGLVCPYVEGFPNITSSSKGKPGEEYPVWVLSHFQTFAISSVRRHGCAVTSSVAIEAAPSTQHECIHLHLGVQHTVLRTAELISTLRKFTEDLPAA